MSTSTKLIHFCLVLSALLAVSAQAETTTFRIQPAAGSSVEFKSEAPLEAIIGKCQAVSGFVEIDPGSSGAGARGEVRVDLTKLKTGIEIRDEHMRKNHLETVKYPEAQFALTSIDVPAASLVDGVRTVARVTGELTIHGQTHTVTPETYLTWSNGGKTLRIESSMMITLAQFQIPRPQFLVMKLAEEQHITVDILAKSE